MSDRKNATLTGSTIDVDAGYLTDFDALADVEDHPSDSSVQVSLIDSHVYLAPRYLADNFAFYVVCDVFVINFYIYLAFIRIVLLLQLPPKSPVRKRKLTIARLRVRAIRSGSGRQAPNGVQLRELGRRMEATRTREEWLSRRKAVH